MDAHYVMIVEWLLVVLVEVIIVGLYAGIIFIVILPCCCNSESGIGL